MKKQKKKKNLGQLCCGVKLYWEPAACTSTSLATRHRSVAKSFDKGLKDLQIVTHSTGLNETAQHCKHIQSLVH